MSDNELIPGPRVYTRRVIRLDGEEVEVTRLAPVPSLNQVTVDDETTYCAAFATAAAAGQLPGTPPRSLARALARASTDDPHLTTTRIRTGIVVDLTDRANVAVARTAFSPLTVLPGEQPRGGSAGGRPGQVREPDEGDDPDATRLGLRVLVFDDTEHLRAWCADAISRSLKRAYKRGRPDEVAATGVRRPVCASMALLQFADGTAAQWVPILSDGISRHTVCAAGLLGLLGQDPADAAAIESLLPVAALTAKSPAHHLARKMRANHDKHVRAYERRVDEDGTADETGVAMRQFLTLPVELHLMATDPETGEPCPMEPAMEAVVSDHHTGVDGWAAEDNSRHTALRALKRLLREQGIDQESFDLCANRTQLEESAALGLDPTAAPGVGVADLDRLLLRRAVTLMSVLLGPDTYPRFKSALRDASGRRRLTMHQVLDYVAPLVCEPWGTQKPITRAWAYGGPVPAWIRNTQIRPVHPGDYLTLVDTAVGPDKTSVAAKTARLELALAGGTALIADGVLTTALVGGSGSASTPLAFRGPVDAAVEALTCTEEGLVALAIAANHFRPSRSSRTARLPAVDLDASDRVARDGVGVPVRITETVLARYAAQAAQGPDAPDSGNAAAGPAGRPEHEPTPLQNLQHRARHLPAVSRNVLRDLELTKTLHDETGGPTGLSEHDLDTVHDSLSTALRLAGRLT